MNYSLKDQQVTWHPYTQMKTAAAAIAIVKGEGLYLIDEHRKRYMDAISSWWVNLHGHSHPYIAQKVSDQLHTLEHVLFAGFTHPPAIELAERLLAILPGQHKRIFYSDNGSTAVEAALKMALQYFYNQDIRRNGIIAFENAYHGDTFGSMSVSGRSVFTEPFRELLFETHAVPVPFPENREEVLSAFIKILDKPGIAAFIYEPLVQGAAGMVMYDKETLDQMLVLCREKGVLLIADEVMTGFGRTGTLFASEHLSVKPDITCLSKGLTGGTLPLGVTSCTGGIYEAFLSDDKTKTFFHGHSFTANPLACTAALASLDLLEKASCREQISFITEAHKRFLEKITGHPSIKKASSLGTILSIEIDAGRTSYLNNIRDYLYEFFLEKGILIRPLGNIIYLLPPYCITPDELEFIYDTCIFALDSLKNEYKALS